MMEPVATGGRRRALVVAAGRYQHEKLADLNSPGKDAEIISRTLGDPTIGTFDEVVTLVDRDTQTVLDTLFDFFGTAQSTDFLFVYISCHGKTTAGNNRLYLAMADTNPDRLPTTAVSGDFVAEQFENCRAATVVMILDCCSAGAYIGDPVKRGGRDRIVILTAGEREFAHEGDQEYFPGRPSPFCGAFFEGIQTGRADDDNNGLITVREAFNYARAKLRQDKVRQSPQIRSGLGDELMLCSAPATADSLPADITALLRHSMPAARRVAADALAGWLSSSNGAQVQAAEQALNALRKDPDEQVAETASRLIAHRSVEGGRTTGKDFAVLDRTRDPLWYRGAICYEIQVRAFRDSNDDGIGDLPGLTSRLDYLGWLGIDCVILSSVFASPWDDDGNDISNFYEVHPSYGTVTDLIQLIDAAHRKGIRVVLDLVLNHTSTAHEWFDKSRRSPDGVYGDYYVWRPADELSNETVDERYGGWSYDTVRRQHYWHRFRSSEPDLNFDLPAVQDEMIAVALHWLGLGVDGFRLIGAPFLFESEEEGGEGLSATHAYLCRLRKAMDDKFQGRALFAWADHWPTDAVEYFGTPERGPECNVVLYASLIPRIFLGMHNQTHSPVSEVLGQAGQLPPDCQWGIFLRNGDEMSLDTIKNEEERDFLVDGYAPLPRMHNPSGIRRRLAPLLGGDRRQLELCMALLLSLPGSPTIYYGDEIGIGENLALPGRAALRTPMQWSGERGGGFSKAEQEEFTRPLLSNSVYGFAAVNVEAQLGSKTSLVSLVRQLIDIRRHSQALAVGTYRSVPSQNRAVFAYLREHGGDIKLCLANFSRYPQATTVTLAGLEGLHVIEASGGARFGTVDGEPFRIALQSHGYFWFSLVNERLAS